jgi:DNA-binding NtrC family response regulator
MNRIKLLIIDDEIVVQQSCVAIFNQKSDSYDLTTVSSGEEALKILEEKSFDIILTDIKMPGLPGLELLSTLSKKYPDTAIIVITGYATVKTAVEAMKLGAVDFIPKPFTPDEIYNAVEKIASRFKQRNRNM